MTTSMRLLRLFPVLGVLVAVAGAAVAGPPTITHEGRDYVELARAAELLKTRLEATPNGTQARLRPSGHVVTLTRNWSRILIDGSPVILDAPVRVRRGVWLVPDTFVAQVLPRVQPAAAASPPTTGPVIVPVAATAAAGPVALTELRFRSYPSFTRIVLETSSAFTTRVETSVGKEARVRLIGLAAEARTEEIGDGFIERARLERAWGATILPVVFGAAAGGGQASALSHPPR